MRISLGQALWAEGMALADPRKLAGIYNMQGCQRNIQGHRHRRGKWLRTAEVHLCSARNLGFVIGVIRSQGCPLDTGMPCQRASVTLRSSQCHTEDSKGTGIDRLPRDVVTRETVKAPPGSDSRERTRRVRDTHPHLPGTRTWCIFVGF